MQSMENLAGDFQEPAEERVGCLCGAGNPDKKSQSEQELPIFDYALGESA